MEIPAMPSDEGPLTEERVREIVRLEIRRNLCDNRGAHDWFDPNGLGLRCRYCNRMRSAFEGGDSTKGET